MRPRLPGYGMLVVHAHSRKIVMVVVLCRSTTLANTVAFSDEPKGASLVPCYIQRH